MNDIPITYQSILSQVRLCARSAFEYKNPNLLAQKVTQLKQQMLQTMGQQDLQILQRVAQSANPSTNTDQQICAIINHMITQTIHLKTEYDKFSQAKDLVQQRKCKEALIVLDQIQSACFRQQVDSIRQQIQRLQTVHEASSVREPFTYQWLKQEIAYISSSEYEKILTIYIVKMIEGDVTPDEEANILREANKDKGNLEFSSAVRYMMTEVLPCLKELALLSKALYSAEEGKWQEAQAYIKKAQG